MNESKLFILLQSSNIKALSFWCQPQDTLANAMASRIFGHGLEIQCHAIMELGEVKLLCSQESWRNTGQGFFYCTLATLQLLT